MRDFELDRPVDAVAVTADNPLAQDEIGPQAVLPVVAAVFVGVWAWVASAQPLTPRSTERTREGGSKNKGILRYVEVFNRANVLSVVPAKERTKV